MVSGAQLFFSLKLQFLLLRTINFLVCASMQDDLAAFSHLSFNIPTSKYQPKTFSTRNHRIWAGRDYKFHPHGQGHLALDRIARIPFKFVSFK